MVGTKVAILDYDVEVVYRRQKNKKVKQNFGLGDGVFTYQFGLACLPGIIHGTAYTLI